MILLLHLLKRNKEKVRFTEGKRNVIKFTNLLRVLVTRICKQELRCLEIRKWKQEVRRKWRTLHWKAGRKLHKRIRQVRDIGNQEVWYTRKQEVIDLGRQKVRVTGEQEIGNILKCSAEIFLRSMGARNRVVIGLSYRPPGLHRLAELIPWNRFQCSLKV
jgi:hypothetical protein